MLFRRKKTLPPTKDQTVFAESLRSLQDLITQADVSDSVAASVEVKTKSAQTTPVPDQVVAPPLQSSPTAAETKPAPGGNASSAPAPNSAVTENAEHRPTRRQRPEPKSGSRPATPSPPKTRAKPSTPPAHPDTGDGIPVLTEAVYTPSADDLSAPGIMHPPSTETLTMRILDSCVSVLRAHGQQSLSPEVVRALREAIKSPLADWMDQAQEVLRQESIDRAKNQDRH